MTRLGILLALAISASVLLLGTLAAQEGGSKAPSKPQLTPAQEAQENYRTVCQPCHGPEGNALLTEMSLADGEWKHGSTPQAVVKSITDGVKGTAMLPFKEKFSREEIAELAKLVRSFDPKLKASAAPKKKL